MHISWRAGRSNLNLCSLAIGTSFSLGKPEVAASLDLDVLPDLMYSKRFLRCSAFGGGSRNIVNGNDLADDERERTS